MSQGTSPGRSPGSLLARGVTLSYLGLMVVLPLLALTVQAVEPGPAAFWKALTNPFAWHALKLTFATAGIMVLINVVTGTATAWVLVRYAFPGKKLMNALIDLPFAVPTVVTGLMLVALYGPTSVLGTFLGKYGLGVIYRQPGIVLALLFVSYPFVIRSVQPVLLEMDRSEEEAAATLGADGFTTFRRVTFPTLWPAILTGTALAFSRALGEFGSVVMVAGNRPLATKTGPMYIFGEIESGNRHGAMVVSVVLLACSLGILIVLNRLQRQEAPFMAVEVAPEPRLALTRRRVPVGRYLLTAAVVAWFALLILVPALALVRGALSGGLKSFFEALASPEARQAFGLTMGITVGATAINTVFGLVLAIVLVRHNFWGKTVVDGLVDLPFAVSPIIAGLMLIVLYGGQGWIGRWLEPMGFHVVYAWPGMLLATIFVTLPFVVREVVPVLREFGVDQEEVAWTLGAGRWRTFRQVTLPSIRWGLAYGVTLTVARSLGEFGALLVVSGNILGRTQTATLYVHDGIESFNTEGAYAASVLLAGVSFFMLIGMELLRKRVEDHEAPE